MDFNSWNIFWSLCFGLLATLIVVGNILTIWIFLKQRRRKRAYFLLISLAVADLLVGVLAVPLFMAAYHTSSIRLRICYAAVDVFTGITSIYTLAVISLERMFAIGWPFRHRTVQCRVYICAIVIPWITATTITIMGMIRFYNIIKQEHFLYFLVLPQSTPLLVMSSAYCVIWKKQKSPMASQNHVAREAKLAKTLLLITGASLLTWLPFQILNVLANLDSTLNFPNLMGTVYIIKLLQYSNSIVNVVIYPFRIPEFKNTLLHVLRCRVVPFRRFNAPESPSTGSGSVISLIRFTNSQFSLADFNQGSSV